MTFLPLMEWCLLLSIALVAGRLFPSKTGFLIAITGGIFWLCLAIVTPWEINVFTRTVFLVAGSTSIAIVGLWSSERTLNNNESHNTKNDKPSPEHSETEVKQEKLQDAREPRVELADPINIANKCILDFNDWISHYSKERDIWPKFDEFLRGLLQTSCGARQIRFYRKDPQSDQLVIMNEDNPGDQKTRSAREGILGHVCTSGKAYLAMDPTTGQYLHELANRTPQQPAWVFPVMKADTCIGAAWVGKLLPQNQPEIDHLSWLPLLASMTSRFWISVEDTIKLNKLTDADPTTGLLSCESFMTEAEKALEESYTRNEPVVLAVIAVEGLRSLGDSGAWDKVRKIIANIASIARQKCRSHDLLGRFDDSRFLLLLRRVDSELAMLIIHQLIDAMNNPPEQVIDIPHVVTYRCGVAGSGFEKPTLHELIQRAANKCHEARHKQVPVHSDLDQMKTNPGRNA